MALLLVGAVAPSGQESVSTNLPLPVLTQARQVLGLSAAEAGRRYPVELDAVVTCFDKRTGLFFVQDASAGIYVYAYQPEFDLRPGQGVRIKGVSNTGRYTPIVLLSELRATGETGAPEPRRVALEQLGAGQFDSQWVEVEGVVRRETEDWGHLVLDLAGDASSLKARVLVFPRRRETSLVDARVRVHGVAATHYNEKGQFTGFHLIVPAYSDVQVVSAGATDPFGLPVTEIRRVMSYSNEGFSGHRVQVHGVVTYSSPGHWFFLQDATGGIRVQTHKASGVKVGDRTAAVGFAVTGEYSPRLEAALVRSLGVGIVPEPKPTTAGQAAGGLADGELIRVEGYLERFSAGAGKDTILQMRTTNGTFRAALAGNRQDWAARFVPGTLLRLTGVCAVGVDELQRPVTFRVWLRSPADVLALSQPSWWTPRRLAWATAVLAGLVGVASLWTWLVQRSVVHRTRLIQQREARLEERYRDLFESANDVIFTCDTQGRLTALNKAGEDLLGRPRAALQGLELCHLAVPAEQARLRQHLEGRLAGQPAAPIEVEIRAKDGRRAVLEITLRPDYQEGRLVGLKGAGRNIIARKEAEAALRESETTLRRTLAERERLAQDLHDNLIQSIYAVGLGLEHCRAGLADHPQEAEGTIARATTQLNAIIRDVRGFIVGLRPEAGPGRSLEEALRGLVADLGPAQAAQVRLDVEVRAADVLDAGQSTHVLNIAREALSNSVRHAAASSTIVSLRRHNGCIRLEVRDDGAGFDPAALATSGCGLHNMAARARELRAHFAVQSRPGQGAAVVLEVPIPPAPHA